MAASSSAPAASESPAAPEEEPELNLTFETPEELLAALPELRPGDSGPLVKELQIRLSSVGYDIKFDGKYGDATRTAVNYWQERLQLTSSGVVGRNTWSGLIEPGVTSLSGCRCDAPLSKQYHFEWLVGKWAGRAGTLQVWPEGTVHASYLDESGAQVGFTGQVYREADATHVRIIYQTSTDPKIKVGEDAVYTLNAEHHALMRPGDTADWMCSTQLQYCQG